METWERTFLKSHLDNISSLPVHYSDNYEQPPNNLKRKVSPFSIDLPPPPERIAAPSASTTAKLTLTIKSSKPPASFSISVSTAETIASVKEVIAAAHGAPPADAQRLLFKGKVLADGKLLKEYNISDRDTVNIMAKPGYVWGTPAPSKSQVRPSDAMALTSNSEVRKVDNLAIPIPMEGIENTDPTLKRSRSRSHSRSNSANIPDLVLSPTPRSTSPNAREIPQDVLLTVDSAAVTTPSETGATSSYQRRLTQPPFWVNFHKFLKGEFEHDEDAVTAFEDFLLASKGNLTASQIAAIRDAVGVLGMAGT